MTELPTGTVTLIFTDIEGSTRLLSSLGSQYEAVLADHRKLLRAAFSSHHGVEVDSQGDALFYAFSRAQDAVAAAVAAQRVLASHDFGEGVELRVRMGIHTGEPSLADEGYVGSDVHLGARISGVAWGGQVVVSSATAALVGGDGGEVSLSSLGEHALKDIEDRVELYQVVAPGLRKDFPALRSVSAHPTNLPARLAPLIGREDEIAEMVELLSSKDISVMTLVGPGGTGKTRLALAVGAELLSVLADGVFFVDLSALSDASLVVPAIAQALSLREAPGRSLTETLEDYLSSKEMVLILDNFEQVMAAAGDVSALVGSSSSLKVVVTSREALRIEGEREFPLHPLALPSSDSEVEEILASPAVELFVARARAVLPGLRVNGEDARHVATICRRLDGLPLAIELAAARVKVLSPAVLASRLENSLAALGTGRRDASDRQRTLAGAIAWSYELLDEDEQRLFARLGVFAGGWSLEAAEAVCDRNDLAVDVLDGIASLVDKSLVRVVEGDEARFSMLETIREFAIEKLQQSDKSEEVRRAHAEFFRRLAEEAEPHLVGAEQKEWLDQLEGEHENLRGAMKSSLGREPSSGLRIAASLRRFWWIRGYLSEGQMWLSQALEGSLDKSPNIRARVLYASGFLAQIQGNNAVAESRCREALELFGSIQDDAGAARALEVLGIAAEEREDLDGARRYHEETLTAYERMNDPRGVAVALGNLSNLALKRNQLVEAEALSKKSLNLYRQLAIAEGVAACLINIGLASLEQRNLEQARVALRECLVIATELDHKELLTHCLIGLAAVASAANQVRDGARLIGVAQRLNDATGANLPLIEKAVLDRTLTEIGAALSEDAIKAALMEGRRTDVRDLS